MKQKQKVSLGVVLGLALAFAMCVPGNAQAKSDWKNYFSTEESKAIKKMVKKSILNELDNPDDDWKGAISKKAVGSSIAKRKVYTGTYVANSAANATYYDSEEDVTYYYQRIDSPEIEISEMPLVFLMTRDSSMDSTFGAQTWINSGDALRLTDGAIWLHLGYLDHTDSSTANSEGESYKLSVSY
ncbi:MAG: hypothetical protein OEV93_01805 [Candidatus Moranbacteria bacterium]|nr:hypothetical protein [Candidatus Moranbacteria bacterium]